MPHSTTKAMRSKRADTRPNAKQRLKMQKRLEEKSRALDLRVVRKSKDEKKGRECQTLQPLRKATKKGEAEKYIGALKKKLRAIGRTLNPFALIYLLLFSSFNFFFAPR